MFYYNRTRQAGFTARCMIGRWSIIQLGTTVQRIVTFYWTEDLCGTKGGICSDFKGRVRCLLSWLFSILLWCEDTIIYISYSCLGPEGDGNNILITKCIGPWGENGTGTLQIASPVTHLYMGITATWQRFYKGMLVQKRKRIWTSQRTGFINVHSGRKRRDAIPIT